MKTIVRKATKEDLPILLEFEQGIIRAERPMDPTLSHEKITYYDIAELIEKDNSEVIVVELDGKIVSSGYAKIVDSKPYLKHTHHGYLGFMFVPEEHRGKGLNKLVLEALLAWCKTKNIYEIQLDVYNDNPPALRAYEKAGFKKHLINMRLDLNDL